VSIERVVFHGFDGINLVADVRGDPDAWPVLFLHGGGQTRHAWGKSAELVAARGWRTISLDQRGHGESDWAVNGDYTFTAFCADCIAVVDQLEKPPVLVGASLGGMAAMLAEGTSDRDVSSGLVLVDIAPQPNPEGIKRIGDFMRSGADGFASLDDAAAAIAAYTPQRKRAVNPKGLLKVLRERDGRWFWHWDPGVMQGDRGEVDLTQLLEVAMGNINVPTLLVRGELSDFVTQAGIDSMVSRLSDVTVVEVLGAAHMLAGDQNDEFTNAVYDFLDGRIRPSVATR
jgi:pimeloyl-ACP methyl ester carboxylesterase